MHVVVGTDGVTLESPHEFDRFDVVRRDGADVGAVLATHGWGRPAATGDVMISVARLRAAGPADGTWRSGLDGMVAYAASKGWLDAEGSHIQAHVVDED
ncbi:hypothetical protein [Desertimonas flava]|jgi:hypothetical protein|uniref:hypothetical protein n=1 Tax=Desertimonas flava TaxID=2064846 RepID=UPI000E35656C|nr:hypothetical protein [Desertimonas flava]